MDIINIAILKHPMNWVTVVLMLIIAGIAAHLVLDSYGITPAKS